MEQDFAGLVMFKKYAVCHATDEIVARNLLVNQVCDNCLHFITIYTKCCHYEYKKDVIIVIPKARTCDNWEGVRNGRK